MYTLTKAAALEYIEKNKFQLKGRYKSERILDQIIQTAPDSSIEELIKEALNKL